MTSGLTLDFANLFFVETLSYDFHIEVTEFLGQKNWMNCFDSRAYEVNYNTKPSKASKENTKVPP